MPISERLRTDDYPINKVLPLARAGIDGIFRDTESPSSYSSAAEFGEDMERAINVPQSEYRIGNLQNILRTYRITACSGFILRDPTHSFYGLFHASPLPFIDLKQYDIGQLALFANGDTIEITGSESTNKEHITKQLQTELDIKLSETLFASTKDSSGINQYFHIAFTPKNNTVLIARNSHRDVIAHQVFR